MEHVTDFDWKKKHSIAPFEHGVPYSVTYIWILLTTVNISYSPRQHCCGKSWINWSAATPLHWNQLRLHIDKLLFFQTLKFISKLWSFTKTKSSFPTDTGHTNKVSQSTISESCLLLTVEWTLGSFWSKANTSLFFKSSFQ